MKIDLGIYKHFVLKIELKLDISISAYFFIILKTILLKN